jgi:hypothetical protein
VVRAGVQATAADTSAVIATLHADHRTAKNADAFTTRPFLQAKLPDEFGLFPLRDILGPESRMFVTLLSATVPAATSRSSGMLHARVERSITGTTIRHDEVPFLFFSRVRYPRERGTREKRISINEELAEREPQAIGARLIRALPT